MSNVSPYKKCPVYETENFILRLVSENDAEDLLECYSDLSAVKLMNSDRCNSDFYYTTINKMKKCIGFWLEEYSKKKYVRFAVVDKQLNKAIGSIEIFGGDYGVLRVDLQSYYEKECYIFELLELSNKYFYEVFETDNIIIKAIPKAKQRISALIDSGFSPDTKFRPNLDYYIKSINKVNQ